MRRYIFLAAALLAGAAASAQNLNPTVQVTNDYETKPMEVEKNSVRMAVPDSLLKFDWNFNYSVFDNPYRGAYEFSPYRIDMKPDATVRDVRKFYLRAGAGYSLHPEAQVAFSPVVKGPWGLTIYDDFKGFSGLYHNITVPLEGEGPYTVGPDGDYRGSDFANRVGATLRHDGGASVITLDAGMDLIRTKEQYFNGNSMLGGSAVLRARSIGSGDFQYDASLAWTGLGNKTLPPDVSSSAAHKYTEHDLGMDARLGYVLQRGQMLRLGTSYHHVIFGEISGQALADVVDLAPAYVYSDNGFSFQAGIRFSNVWRDYKYDEEYYNAHYLDQSLLDVADYKGNKIFPDVRLSYEAVPDKLVLSAKVVGGQKFNTYGSYLKGNHHLPAVSSYQYSRWSGDATVNTFDAGVGISGRVKHVFQYGAEAGFARYFNAPMPGIIHLHELYTSDYAAFPFISMTNYDLLYADATGALATDRVDASARLRLQKSNLKPEMERGYPALDLPLFTGSAEFVYNWNRRVFAGISAEWQTSRKGEGMYVSYGTPYDCFVPGWVDLGVSAEFRLSHRFSLWAEGRNLLNQTVMRNFMISEKGPYFTAGICLNL